MLIEVRSWHEVSDYPDENVGTFILAHIVHDHPTLAAFVDDHPPRKVQLRTFVGDERSDHVVNPTEWTAVPDQGAQ